MSIADRRGGQRVVPAFLSYGFRPFFWMGALWSAAALLVWIVIFVAGGSLPSRFDPLGWHIHEMLFGFVMATIAGFLPTAMWLLKIVSGLAQMPRWVILTSG